MARTFHREAVLPGAIPEHEDRAVLALLELCSSCGCRRALGSGLCGSCAREVLAEHADERTH